MIDENSFKPATDFIDAVIALTSNLSRLWQRALADGVLVPTEISQQEDAVKDALAYLVRLKKELNLTIREIRQAYQSEQNQSDKTDHAELRLSLRQHLEEYEQAKLLIDRTSLTLTTSRDQLKTVVPNTITLSGHPKRLLPAATLDADEVRALHNKWQTLLAEVEQHLLNAADREQMLFYRGVERAARLIVEDLNALIE